jgi:hypothetical protein
MKTRAYSAGLLALLLFVGMAPAYATQTPAGTTISNTATASYTDSNGNALTATSNTVSTVVQNAPTMTDTNGGNQFVAPNTNVTDTFTLTNTGNNAGDFQIASPTLSGGSATLTSYTVTLPTGSTYNGSNSTTNGAAAPTTAQTFTSLASLNTFLGSVNVPSSSAATVAVNYATGATAAGTTITDTLPATITYPAAGAAPTATSATATSTETDTVQNDARLDVRKTSAQNTTTGVITYTVAVNNGGAFTAHYVQALEQSSFGFGTATTASATAPGGILIVDKVPVFNSAPLTLNATPTVSFTRGTNGFPSDTSETAAVYCTTAATPGSGWSTSCPTNGTVTYVGVLISGGTLTNSSSGGDGLLSNPSGSTATGGTSPSGPNVTAPAVTLTFAVNQPTGNGSGTTGSVTNVADSIFTNNNTTPQIVGPGGPYTDGNTAAAATNATTAESNPTPNTSGGTPGASGQTSNQALAAYAVLVGPSGFPAALGDATNTGTATNNGDFTDWSFVDATSPTTTSTTPGATVTGNSTTSVDTMCVPFTVQNAGNLQDSAITLAATAPTSPSGWTAQFFSNAGCTAVQGGSTAGATTSTTAITLASGSSMTLYVKYSAPVGTPAFTAEQAVITATGSPNGATANTNTTYDELYDGFIALVKQQTVISSGCPTGVTVTTICPGGVLGYTITVENLAKGATGTGVNEPASALLTNSTAGIVVADDGTASSSWFAQIGSTGTYVTSGVNAVPTLTIGGTANTASVCTYSYGNPAASPSTTFTAPSYTIGSLSNGPSKLSCVLGGAVGSAYQLPAGSNTAATWMVFSFNVTVRAN